MIGFSTLRRKNFLGVCGFFLRNVDGFLGDLEGLKVKRYLFSRPHFLGGWRGQERIKEDKKRGGERRGERGGGGRSGEGGAGTRSGEGEW